MDSTKHRRMEDEHNFLMKTMKGATVGLIPGILWGILATAPVGRTVFPGLIPALKITGGTGAICAGTGALWVGVEQLLEKSRKKRGLVNGVGGAFFAGAAFFGLRHRSIKMAITGGFAFAVNHCFLDEVQMMYLRSQSGK